MDHKLAHNSNASQLWLVAHLPEEPPEVSPASIHGPVLLTAESAKTEEYVDLKMADWWVRRVRGVRRWVHGLCVCGGGSGFQGLLLFGRGMHT